MAIVDGDEDGGSFVGFFFCYCQVIHPDLATAVRPTGFQQFIIKKIKK